MYVCQKKTVECDLLGLFKYYRPDDICIENFTLDETQPLGQWERKHVSTLTLPVVVMQEEVVLSSQGVSPTSATSSNGASPTSTASSTAHVKEKKVWSKKEQLSVCRASEAEKRAEAAKAEHARAVTEQKALFAADKARRVGAKAAAKAPAAATAPKKARVEREESVPFMRAPSPPDDWIDLTNM